jgi:hypothetical protein
MEREHAQGKVDGRPLTGSRSRFPSYANRLLPFSAKLSQVLGELFR